MMACMTLTAGRYLEPAAGRRGVVGHPPEAGGTCGPRSSVTIIPNPTDAPARIIAVLTPGGTERWFEEVAALADEDDAGFADACRRHGIEFRLDSPWIPRLRGRYGLRAAS
jgi:hypothetical protein